METVILANGKFPGQKIPIEVLNNAKQIICCDGAANNLIQYGLVPFVIIGDLDSLDTKTRNKYAEILVGADNQDTNDLTKAVDWCVENNKKEVIIIGATGKREDHTIGNISLLAQYIEKIKVKMISDYGEFIPIVKSTMFNSFKGQQVSLFSINPQSKISSENLKYPLVNYKLDAWWKGTLNECTGDYFSINFDTGKVIVYKLF